MSETRGKPVLLPAGLVQALKVRAAQEDTTIRELTEAAIVAYLGQKTQGHGRQEKEKKEKKDS
jgi:hypothetical protein